MILDVLNNDSSVYKESRQLEEVLPELDVLYMTRVQKERFFSEDAPMRIIKCPLRYFAAKVGQRFDLSKKSCIFVHCYLILIYDKSRNC